MKLLRAKRIVQSLLRWLRLAGFKPVYSWLSQVKLASNIRIIAEFVYLRVSVLVDTSVWSEASKR